MQTLSEYQIICWCTNKTRLLETSARAVKKDIIVQQQELHEFEHGSAALRIAEGRTSDSGDSTPPYIMAAGPGLRLSNTFADNCEMPREACLWGLTHTYDTYCLLNRASTTENDCQHVSNIPKLCQSNSLKVRQGCHGSKAACQHGGCS